MVAKWNRQDYSLDIFLPISCVIASIKLSNFQSYCLCIIGTLNLSYNQLNGSLANQFQTMSQLESINLDFNQFEGTLDEILNCGNCTNTLTAFSAIGNPLSGDIPARLFDFSMLSSFSVSKSKLNGTIPADFGRLTALSYLDLRENYYFSNETVLPSEIGRLTNLKTLTVSNSVVFGEVPAEFSNMSSLEFLGIARTSQTGSIPNTVCAIDTLKTIQYSSGVNCLCPGNICELVTEHTISY